MVGNNPINRFDPFGLTGCDDFIKTLVRSFTAAGNRDALGDEMLGKMHNRFRDYTGFKPELIAGGQNAGVMNHIYGHGGAIVKYGLLGYFGSLYNQGLDWSELRFGNRPLEKTAEIADDRAGREVGMELLRAFARRSEGGCQTKQANILNTNLHNILCQ
jgi:hypothetical protein